ncbi:MAG: histidine kinase, partial [Citrobacter freundii]
MTSQGNELCILADALAAQREGLLQTWRKAVRRDPALTAGEALPRTQLNDHIPAVLAA